MDLVKGRPKGTSQAFSGLSWKDKGKMTPMQMFCCWLSCGKGLMGGGWIWIQAGGRVFLSDCFPFQNWASGSPLVTVQVWAEDREPWACVSKMESWVFCFDVIRNTKSPSPSCTRNMNLCVHWEPFAQLVGMSKRRLGVGSPWTVHFGCDRNRWGQCGPLT